MELLLLPIYLFPASRNQLRINVTRITNCDSASAARRHAPAHNLAVSPAAQDVWLMKWSDDDPELFAAMEKAKLVVLRGLDAEEPVVSASHIVAFHDLEIRSVDLDSTVQHMEQPELKAVAVMETRSLR